MKAPSKRCSIRVSKKRNLLPNDMASPAAENQKQRSCSVTFVLACNVFLSLHLLVFLCVRSSRPALILLFLLSITSAMFVVLTICGHRHVPFPASTTKRPTWLYRGFTSYEQTEWLRNTLLVKRISCLVHKVDLRLWLYQRKVLLTLTQKHASTFPRNGAMQKGHKQEKANMAVSGLYLLRANCMVAYHTLNVRSQQQGINFDWW